jgi:hypothetical protein
MILLTFITSQAPRFDQIIAVSIITRFIGNYSSNSYHGSLVVGAPVHAVVGGGGVVSEYFY